MAEKRNERAVFEGAGRHKRSSDRRRPWPRRKADWILIVAKYLVVAGAAALLAKYFG
jgi:hypothetical protein